MGGKSFSVGVRLDASSSGQEMGRSWSLDGKLDIARIGMQLVMKWSWTGYGHQLVMVWFWSLCGALVVRLQSGKGKELDRTTVALLRLQIKFKLVDQRHVYSLLAASQTIRHAFSQCRLELRLVLPRRTGGATDWWHNKHTSAVVIAEM